MGAAGRVGVDFEVYWLNDWRGQFSDSGFRFGDDQFYRHILLGDLDGDGDLDSRRS